MIIWVQGQAYAVSDIDADLAEYEWYINSGGYAKLKKLKRQPVEREYSMHRIVYARKIGVPIIELPSYKLVDHTDRNRWNNTRENLRVADNDQNRANAPTSTDSGYKGVYWSDFYAAWDVVVMFRGQVHSVGQFHDINEAARAYNQAATKIQGEYAYLNATDDQN